ncbi:unnamed protein product, partial [Ceratitis capitata]
MYKALSLSFRYPYFLQQLVIYSSTTGYHCLGSSKHTAKKNRLNNNNIDLIQPLDQNADLLGEICCRQTMSIGFL